MVSKQTFNREKQFDLMIVVFFFFWDVEYLFIISFNTLAFFKQMNNSKG